MKTIVKLTQRHTEDNGMSHKFRQGAYISRHWCRSRLGRYLWMLRELGLKLKMSDQKKKSPFLPNAKTKKQTQKHKNLFFKISTKVKTLPLYLDISPWHPKRLCGSWRYERSPTASGSLAHAIEPHQHLYKYEYIINTYTYKC